LQKPWTESGNPKGRPLGAKTCLRARMRRLMDCTPADKILQKLKEQGIELMDNDNAEVLTHVVHRRAQKGEPFFVKLVYDLNVPPRKDGPIMIDLPVIESLADATKAMAYITNAVSVGEITPSEGQGLSVIIENYRKIIETTDVEKRIVALESSASK